MASFARAVHFPSRNARQTNVRALRTPDGAVAVPDARGGALESLTRWNYSGGQQHGSYHWIEPVEAICSNSSIRNKIALNIAWPSRSPAASNSSARSDAWNHASAPCCFIRALAQAQVCRSGVIMSRFLVPKRFSTASQACPIRLSTSIKPSPTTVPVIRTRFST